MKKQKRKKPINGEYFFFINHKGEVISDIINESDPDFWLMWEYGNYFEDKKQAKIVARFHKKENLLLQRI